MVRINAQNQFIADSIAQNNALWTSAAEWLSIDRALATHNNLNNQNPLAEALDLSANTLLKKIGRYLGLY
ncbi:MAG: hypothetical protein GC193_09030 [Cryomorphaceae bacterium]|nr:hypothetical protein [Cryomorphaceae bacterium]